jgi:O-antigen biosynthesis protein WbqP
MPAPAHAVLTESEPQNSAEQPLADVGCPNPLDIAAKPTATLGRGNAFYLASRVVIESFMAAIIFAVSLPGLIALLILIRITSEGPGLFWSHRVGRNGRVFRMPKFRTMYDGTELMQREKMSAPVDAVTPIGGWLRRWSLDELPQLWSIIIGEMAFIGPRPLIPEDEAQAQRDKLGLDGHIRPGLTGLAQINGRNSVSPRAKARYDVFYARRVSLGLDLMILRRTVRLVLRGTGIW